MNGGMSAQAANRTAACACGALKVRVSGEPAIVNICSCLACQRRSGSALTYTAFFPDAQIIAVEGDSKSWRRDAHSGGAHDSHFCPTCGVAVYFRLAAAPGMTAVAAGCFSDPAMAAPSRFYWTGTRHHWLGPIEGAEDLAQQ